MRKYPLHLNKCYNSLPQSSVHDVGDFVESVRLCVSIDPSPIVDVILIPRGNIVNYQDFVPCLETITTSCLNFFNPSSLLPALHLVDHFPVWVRSNHLLGCLERKRSFACEKHCKGSAVIDLNEQKHDPSNLSIYHVSMVSGSRINLILS